MAGVAQSGPDSAETDLALLLVDLERFKAMVEATSDWLWEVDARGVYTYASPKVRELLGYEPEEVLGKTPFDFMPPDEAVRAKAVFLPIAEQRRRMESLLNVNLHKDGHLVVLETSGVPVFDEAGEYQGYRGVDRDVTERVHAEERERLSDAVLRAAAEGILVAGRDGRVLMANPAFLAMTGFVEEQVVGHALTMLSAGVGETRQRVLWSVLDNTARWSGEGTGRSSNGEPFPVWLTLSSVRDEGGVITGYVAVVSDMTERRAAEETIRFQATHDALTSLANRTYFMSTLNKALEAARSKRQQVAVLFVDLDGFKPVNDDHGHGTGDLLLAAVARRLERCTRKSDLVARIGGDEFTIFVEGPQVARVARRIGETIVRRLAEPFHLDGKDLELGCSVGIAVFPEDGDNVDALVGAADKAMYEAKQAGGSRVFTGKVPPRKVKQVLARRRGRPDAV